MKRNLFSCRVAFPPRRLGYLPVLLLTLFVFCSPPADTVASTIDLDYPAVRDFGRIERGMWLIGSFYLRNVGTDPVSIAPYVENCGSVFSILVSGNPNPNWPRVIAPGEVFPLSIRFQSTVAGQYECRMYLRPDLPPTILKANCVLPGDLYDYESPAEVSFGEVQVWQQVSRTVTFRNVGHSYFSVTPSLAAGGIFTITSGGGRTNIAPGATLTVTVACLPNVMGDFRGQLNFDLYDHFRPVELVGRGLDPDASWTLNPGSVSFPYTEPGQSHLATIAMCNTGTWPLNLNPQLESTTSAFAIVGGGENTALVPSECRDIVIRFEPPGIGKFVARLDLGLGLPAVPIVGLTGVLPDSCGVTPTALNYGSIQIGQTLTRSFTITNTSGQVISARPVSSSPWFEVQGIARQLQPGQATNFLVAFTPEQEGRWSGEIMLGDAACPVVACVGEAYQSPPGNSDRLGIFFNGTFDTADIQLAAGEIAQGAIVLLDPSDQRGVLGWECRVAVEGEVFFLGWDLEGAALNIAQPPEFTVGISRVPLPASNAVRFVTFEAMVLDSRAPVYLSLVPTSTPSIPGEMAWVSTEVAVLIPMTTVTGVPKVASINGALATEVLPAPYLARSGSRVRLEWSIGADAGGDCHVYRREAASAPERLTAQPLAASGGHFAFVDQPTGFDPGTRLSYSYTISNGGVEGAASREVDYVVGQIPVLRTGLLPNIPNPFNPSTTIRFELAAPQRVKVAIYDVTGRLVQVLAEEHLAAGSFSRLWSGRDSRDRPVASGAYYVRLSAEGRVDHRKIMLLK